MTYDHNYCIECTSSPCKCPGVTKMVDWRGGKVEFVRPHIITTPNNHEDIKKAYMPPWYIVHISGGHWSTEGWYSWLDYQGPPKVFLTEGNAQKHADAMMNQYKGCQAVVKPVVPDGWAAAKKDSFQKMTEEIRRRLEECQKIKHRNLSKTMNEKLDFVMDVLVELRDFTRDME